MVYWAVLIHGLRAIHSVNSSALVFEDAYLNEVQSLWEWAPGLNFGSTTFSVYVCERFTHSCEALLDEYVC